MIKLLRIDERLIHGQVANQWSKQLNVNAIVVANDAAAANELVEMTLRMAAPTGVKVAIKRVSEAIELLNDPRSIPLTIFVVVDNPKDALEVVKNVKDIPYVNIGNFGRVGIEKANRDSYTPGLFANEEEVKTFNEIIATGITCEIRMLTTDTAKDLDKVINKK